MIKLVGCLHSIANTGFCENVLRLGGVGLDFVSQLANIYAEILRVDGRGPKLVEQEFVGRHFPGMLHQDSK